MASAFGNCTSSSFNCNKKSASNKKMDFCIDEKYEKELKNFPALGNFLPSLGMLDIAEIKESTLRTEQRIYSKRF